MHDTIYAEDKYIKDLFNGYELGSNSTAERLDEVIEAEREHWQEEQFYNPSWTSGTERQEMKATEDLKVRAQHNAIEVSTAFDLSL